MTCMRAGRLLGRLALGASCAWAAPAWDAPGPDLAPEATASSIAAGTSVRGPLDGDRFSTESASLWRGERGAGPWWWGIGFADPRRVGAILQVNGADAGILRDAPGRYVWQASDDGLEWIDLPETRVERERRLFRIHRLSSARRARFLRIRIDASIGEAPALREVELDADPGARIAFPDWIVAVATTERPTLPGETSLFVDLARQCEGWEKVQAQQVWLGEFDRSFVEAEPRPLCAFLTGNVEEWCQRTRGPGALTENQCLRVRDRYIYAAQFHIEMSGTPETSRTIMRNFLDLARGWGRGVPRK